MGSNRLWPHYCEQKHHLKFSWADQIQWLVSHSLVHLDLSLDLVSFCVVNGVEWAKGLLSWLKKCMPEETEFIYFLMLKAANYVYISSLILYCCAVPLDNNKKTVHGVAWSEGTVNDLMFMVMKLYGLYKQSDIATVLNSFFLLSFQAIFSTISLICLFMMPGIQLTFSFTILWYSY